MAPEGEAAGGHRRLLRGEAAPPGQRHGKTPAALKEVHQAEHWQLSAKGCQP